MCTRFSFFYITVLVAVTLGCSDASNQGPSALRERGGSQGPIVQPERCASLPSFAEATSRIDAEMDAIAPPVTSIEPASGYAALVPLSLGYDLASAEDANDAHLKTPRILRSADEVTSDASLAWMIDDFTIDWATEVAIVTEERPSQIRYRYTIDGDTFRVVTGQARPCLSALDDAVQQLALASTRVRILRAPKAVTRAMAEAVPPEDYRPALPAESGACKRAEGVVFHGGGNASLVRHDAGVRLYVNGFSAMTGNVFFIDSTDDGASFSPNGWDDENLSSFQSRGPYADVYNPFVERTPQGFRMTANMTDKDIARRSRLVEMISSDGKAWSEGQPLLPLPPEHDSDPRGASRITVDGEDRLFFVMNGEVRLARRRGEPAFALEPEPVLAIPPVTSDSFAALGYLDASIVHAGDRYVLFVTGAMGGYARSLPLRTSLGYAVSTDGMHFELAEVPVLVSRSEEDVRGVGAPAVLPSADGTSFTLFYTAINASAEPIVTRAICEGL